MKNVLLPVVIDSSILAMEVIKKIGAARDKIAALKGDGISIGLVPTMGALHQGHLSLVERSTSENDITIASIFVNPIQFNNKKDLTKYPVSIKEDLAALEENGCSYVFMPSVDEMYPSDPKTSVSFGRLDTIMEGKHRPGHFNGVAIVVAKLFAILSPTRAYFGQKDLQQYKIIEQLVRDLSLAVEMRMMPIIREANGLAMSSRNQQLSNLGKEISGEIYTSMNQAADSIMKGLPASQAIEQAYNHLMKFEAIQVEYFEVVNFDNLSEVRTETNNDPLVLCFAGYVENIRLIDNLIIERKKEEG